MPIVFSLAIYWPNAHLHVKGPITVEILHISFHEIPVQQFTRAIWDKGLVSNGIIIRITNEYLYFAAPKFEIRPEPYQRQSFPIVYLK